MREYQNFATSLQFRYIAKFSLYSVAKITTIEKCLLHVFFFFFFCLNDFVLVFLLSTLIVIVLVRLVW